jgi:hypothetical protein
MRKYAEHMMSIKRESDILYVLSFIPKSGIAEKNDTLVDNPFCIHLPGNPINNPDYITNAIKLFESNNNIESWSDLAVSYDVRKIDRS